MREGWELMTLADLFDIGSSKRVYESQWRDSGVPFYRAREIVKLSRDGFVDNELFIDEDLYKEYANKYGIPKCGDIMVTGVGTLGVCYVVKENDRFYFKDGNTLWFKTKKDTNPFFVNYAFKSNHIRQQIENCNGATVGTFTIVRAKQTTIPVPPIEEQERIVSELDLLSGIIEKKKDQLKEYDQLAQSIFYDMFGDPVANEKGWEVKRLEELLKIPSRNGLSKPTAIRGNGVPMISMGEMFANPIITDSVKATLVPVTERELETSQIVSGDLLFARQSLSLEGAGKCSFVKSCSQPTVFESHLIRIRVNENDVLGKYVFCYFQTPCGIAEVRKRVYQVAAAGIKGSELVKIPILMPPLSLQQKFAEKIEVIEHQKELIKQSITETETLFNSRMDYYFN